MRIKSVLKQVFLTEEENKKTFKNVLTINPKDVIINESSKTTQ